MPDGDDGTPQVDRTGVTTHVAPDMPARLQLLDALPSRSGPHLGRITDGNVGRGHHVRLPDRLIPLLPAPAAAHGLFLRTEEAR